MYAVMSIMKKCVYVRLQIKGSLSVKCYYKHHSCLNVLSKLHEHEDI